MHAHANSQYLTMNMAFTCTSSQVGDASGVPAATNISNKFNNGLPANNGSHKFDKQFDSYYFWKKESLLQVEEDGRLKGGANHKRGKTDMGSNLKELLQPHFNTIERLSELSRRNLAFVDSQKAIYPRSTSRPPPTRHARELVGDEGPDMARQSPMPGLRKKHRHSKSPGTSVSPQSLPPQILESHSTGRESSTDSYVSVFILVGAGARLSMQSSATVARNL